MNKEYNNFSIEIINAVSKKGYNYSRINIDFDAIPDENTRTYLKSNYFKWDKREKVWFCWNNKQNLKKLTELDSLYKEDPEMNRVKCYFEFDSILTAEEQKLYEDTIVEYTGLNKGKVIITGQGFSILNKNDTLLYKFDVLNNLMQEIKRKKVFKEYQRDLSKLMSAGLPF